MTDPRLDAETVTRLIAKWRAEAKAIRAAHHVTSKASRQAASRDRHALRNEAHADELAALLGGAGARETPENTINTRSVCLNCGRAVEDHAPGCPLRLLAELQSLREAHQHCDYFKKLHYEEHESLQRKLEATEAESSSLRSQLAQMQAYGEHKRLVTSPHPFVALAHAGQWISNVCAQCGQTENGHGAAGVTGGAASQKEPK